MNETEWLAEFASALKRSDIDAATALFADDCYWRDLVAFTWNIVTLESRSAIAEMLQTRLGDVKPDSFVLSGRPGWFTFETAQGRGKGHVRLKDGKAWTFFTALLELKGFEEKKGPAREHGTQHGAFRDRVTWTDRRKADAVKATLEGPLSPEVPASALSHHPATTLILDATSSSLLSSQTLALSEHL